MNRQIVRQAALERLSSPEGLDRPTRLVGSGAWLALLVLVVAMTGAILWSITASAPVKVMSQGVMLEDGGLLDIRSSESGRLTALPLVPGTVVRSGDVVARIAQPELTRKVANARGRLEAAQNRYARLKSFFDESRGREQRADGERLETINETINLLTERLRLLEEKLASVRKLIASKALPSDRLIGVYIEVSDARERIATLEDEAASIRLRRLDRESERRIQLLDQRLAIEDLEREHLRLEALLDERGKVLSPYDGRVVEVKVNVGDVLASTTALATVAPHGVAGSGELYGLLYIPPTEGKQVQPGMRVEIAPSTVRREEFGYLKGEVVSIAPLPASLEGMRRQLQNDQLVRQLSGSGAPFEARVRLEKDASTPSGYAWSSSRGPVLEINAGTLFEGRVIVRRIRLLSLLAPGLERFIGGEEDG